MTDTRNRCFGITPGRLSWLLLFVAAACGWCLAEGTQQTGAQQTAGSTPDQESVRAMIQRAEGATQATQLEALAKDLTPLEREWGIKLLGIRRTAAGYVLDLRYKVLDADKALPVLHRTFNPNPYVIVERSGAKLGVPFTDKAGSLRSSVSSAGQIRKGRNYGVLFANPGRHARAGDQVTLVMGSFRAEHLVVQ